jgi:transposase InsO family protein
LSLWPSVDLSALDFKEQQPFRSRQTAIRLYIEEADRSLISIERETGVERKTLYRMIDRCIARHPDGRIYGFRALIPYAHLKKYERLQILVKSAETSGTGLSGAFSQLLQRYPQLEKMLLRYAKQRQQYGGAPHKVRWPLGRIHQKFLAQCRELGVKPNEYPLNQALGGMRSLAEFLRHCEIAMPSASSTDDEAPVINSLPEHLPAQPAVTRAFEVVEFDGHKIDLRVAVRLTDPLGFSTLAEINRIWILVLLDVASRTVIGYKLALSKEYNKDDVASALQAALMPFRPRQYTIPGLKMREGGGFPSHVIPETEYACWDWFRFDGAKAHFAQDTLTRLNQIVGCWPDNGPPGQPNKRPFVERFFQLLAQHFAHRLPGTTGSNFTSIEKLLGDPHGDIRLLVELEELEDMVEVLIGDYNGTPHSGLFHRTPLEAMAQLLARDKGYLRTLPRIVRQNLCLLQEARIKPIKGNTTTSVRPHINFLEVRYTNDILMNSIGLIGKKVRIYFDVRDIRTVKAFFEDGSELGVLTAARPWCYTPHSLRVRREILRLKRQGDLRWREGSDPVESWEKFKRQQLRTSRRAASDLAKTIHTQSPMPAQISPILQSSPSTADRTSIPTQTVAPPCSASAESSQGSPGVLSAAVPEPRVMRLKRTIIF